MGSGTYLRLLPESKVQAYNTFYPKDQFFFRITFDHQHDTITDPFLTLAAYQGLKKFKEVTAMLPYSIDLSTLKQGIILIAVAGGQIELLKSLTRPTKEGGYGFILENSEDLLMMAAAHQRIELLVELLKPREKGGFGLKIETSKTNDSLLYIQACVKNKELSSLLLSPEPDGYGLTLKTLVMTKLLNVDLTSHAWFALSRKPKNFLKFVPSKHLTKYY